MARSISARYRKNDTSQIKTTKLTIQPVRLWYKRSADLVMQEGEMMWEFINRSNQKIEVHYLTAIRINEVNIEFLNYNDQKIYRLAIRKRGHLPGYIPEGQ